MITLILIYFYFLFLLLCCCMCVRVCVVLCCLSCVCVLSYVSSHMLIHVCLCVFTPPHPPGLCCGEEADVLIWGGYISGKNFYKIWKMGIPRKNRPQEHFYFGKTVETLDKTVQMCYNINIETKGD